MDNLKELGINVSGNLEYANVCIDLPPSSYTPTYVRGQQPELNMMNNEEIELALNCAMNIKKHLTRVLEKRKESELENKLQYVNNLIQEGGMRASF
jgi:hypothetical protein